MPLPSSLHEVPFIKLIIPLLVGIAVQSTFGILPSSILLVYFAPALIVALIFCNIASAQWRFRWLYGVILNIAIFICGLFLPISYDNPQIFDTSVTTDAIVKIVDKPQVRVKSFRVEGEILGVFSDGNLKPVDQKILLYFSIADSLVQTLNYADVLALRFNLQHFDEPTNPYQFNFAQYMQRKGIEYSAFVADGEWQKVGSNPNVVIKLAKDVRSKLLGLFVQSGLNPDELAVVSALTVGYKDLLDDELRKTYSAAGATHILAVSGLHVGIIYGLLVIILSAIPKLNKRIKLVISIAFLWFFAFITGLSPSVLRATAMFTMVEIGRAFGYRANTYNTLAAVAFILLVAEPNNLYNMGFQLSFLAVLSIVYFFPHIRALLHIKNRVLSWIWDLLAVSLAAQIGTLPIILLNFGQFSNYFLLTNMLAIPMASVILYLAVLLIIISAIPSMLFFVGKILGFSVWVLNSGLKAIEQLPGSVASGIYCSEIQSLMLFVAIILLAYFIEKKRPIALQSAIVALCVFFALNHRRSFSNSNPELVVFDLPRKSVLCLKNNQQTVFFDTDTAAVDLLKSYSFYISGYVQNKANSQAVTSCNLGRFGEDLGKNVGVNVWRKNGLAVISMNGYKVVFPYNDSSRYCTSAKPLNVDLLVVNRYVDESVLKNISPQMAVFDGSVWADKFPLLAVSMLSKGVEVYNLQTQGAYISKL